MEACFISLRNSLGKRLSYWDESARRWFRIVQCLFMVTLPTIGSAQFLREIPAGEEWKELEVQLPKYPRPENLIATQVSSLTSFTFAVDGTSIVIGQDGVVRFVVVARSPDRAENVSYEGIRCSTRERKLYAVGRADGTWLVLKSPVWINFQGARVNSYHDSFARQYFCIERTPVLDAAKANELLRKR